ncbi:SDR family oxidoreductase [Sorangium atrum]|uniref:Peroxisomal trans-2-enoyl-CoA reductase n=1 Tax=Sorangium atrum TaxID=2995308 RepID=A0ABT5C9G6_9BACT|nr:SDR family oxidoreductase [Sorangium aterium]MDC0682450.1 SDR family oxidoreductase [Sorangium aterium]
MTQVRSIFAPGLFGHQVAIVTGGGSGIGLACARELAYLGAKVALCGRRADKLEAAAKTLAGDGVSGDDVLAAPCDIREPEQIAAFVGQVLGKFGRVDVLVNNAGGQFPSPAMDMTPKGWEAVVRNNLNGTFYMTREVARRAMLPARRGRIVNVTASVSRGFPGMAHTGAARAGVENLTRSLAVEWAALGIRVNAVAPGSNIRSSGTSQYGDELLELARRATPLKRLAAPEEVSRLIVFLASDQNDFITGAVYGIDGGQPLWGDIWSVPEPDGAPSAPPDAKG